MFSDRSWASSMISVSYAREADRLAFPPVDAVGHQLDQRTGLRAIGEADLVADQLPARCAQPATRAWRCSTRQCVAVACDRSARRCHVQARDRSSAAGSFCLTRFATDDHNLIRLDSVRNLLACTGYWKIFRESNNRAAVRDDERVCATLARSQSGGCIGSPRDQRGVLIGLA